LFTRAFGMTDLWAGSLGNMAGPIKRGGGSTAPAGRDKLLAAEANRPVRRRFAGGLDRSGRR